MAEENKKEAKPDEIFDRIFLSPAIPVPTMEEFQSLTWTAYTPTKTLSVTI